MTLSWGAATDVGKVRRLNEDAHLETSKAFVVADGMGGHQSGDVASRLVIEAIDKLIGRTTPDIGSIGDVVSNANDSVRAHANESGTEGMGSTLVGLFLVKNADQESLVVVNVGDSRCYTLVDGVLTQVTKDHSHVQELVDDGLITPDEALIHRDRNVVTRAIGIEEIVAGDFFVLPSAEHMRVLLCSDGVSGELSSSRIEELLEESTSPSEAAAALIAEVLTGRAADNATAVVIDARRTLPIGATMDGEVEITGPRRPAATGDVDITARLPRVGADTVKMITTVPTITPDASVPASKTAPTVLIGDVPR